MKKQGFTLIELIVVITILAILGTIAFISFKGYSSDARDSKRISEIGSLNKAIGIYLAQKGTVPEPENSVKITYGSENLTIQGEAGERILDEVSASKDFKDPSSSDYYLYATNDSKNKYEVFTFLEGKNAYITSTFANSDRENSFSKGTGVGYVFNSDGTQLTSDLDIKNNAGTFKFVNEEGTNDAKEVDLLYLKEKFDDFLVGHWDMSTQNSDGTLKDLSGNGNNGTISGSPTIFDGKMVFDGVDDYVEIPDSSSLDIDKAITILVKFKSTEDKNSILLNKRNTASGQTSASGNYKIAHNVDNNIGFFYQPTTVTDKASYTPHDTYPDNVNHTLIIKNIFGDVNSLSAYNNGTKSGLTWASGREGNTGVLTSNDSFVIGAEKDAANALRNYFKGEIDEVKIFNTALPINAIRKLSK